mgnify:FL=1
MADVGIKTVTDYLIFLYPNVVLSILMQEFQKRSKIAFDIFQQKLKKSNIYRNTLCHGDLWTTNILFKFDNIIPLDCRLVDFQLIRYCPPAQDLMSHIYLTTEKETRVQFLPLLLQEYYEELTNIVTSFGLDVEQVLPFKEF